MAKRVQPSSTKSLSLPVQLIERRIYLMRGIKVMLDSDLAELYTVPTKVLNQAVKRNVDRFPEDFMFQLSPEESEAMRSQIVTAFTRNVRFQPYAFTEQGVAMLSSVLSSKRAVQVNIGIMRAFVRLRDYLGTHKELAKELEDLKRATGQHGAHIQKIYGIIEKLIKPESVKPRRIGFRMDPA